MPYFADVIVPSTTTGALWAWNRTNTSQFTRVVGTGTLATGTIGGNVPTLAVTGPSRSIWTINDLDELPDRFMYLALMESNNFGVGICTWYQDTTHWVVHELKTSGSTGVWPTRMNGGGAQIATAICPIGNAAEITRVNIEVVSTAYNEVVFDGTALQPGTGGSAGIVHRLETAGDWTGGGALSGWTDSERFAGISIDAASNTRHITEMAIFRHPMDAV